MCIGTNEICSCCKRTNYAMANFNTCGLHVADVENSTKNCKGVLITNIPSTCSDCLRQLHTKNCNNGNSHERYYLKKWV